MLQGLGHGEHRSHGCSRTAARDAVQLRAPFPLEPVDRLATQQMEQSPQSINGAAAGRWHRQGLETTRAKPLVLISTEKD